jgi:ABC transporter substrate binding protein/Crp-like helix-turn-helix domain
LTDRLLALTARELARKQDHLLLLLSTTAEERIISFLIEMVQRASPREDDLIDLPMSRRDIADYLGLTIETVSRILWDFERRGAIEISGRHKSRQLEEASQHKSQFLAKPGGNMTGFTSLDPTMGGKWIELLKEIAPRTVRVALLFNPATAMPFQFLMPSIDTAASSFAVEVKAAPVRDKEELEKIISTQAHPPGGGLVVMPDVFNTRNRDLIIALAAKYGVPAIYFNPTYFAESGGLIGYSDDYEEECRLAAGYIDRILKGEQPGDLPVQNPTKYQLIINLKTAKALGLTIPPTLFARADEMIE